jgi:predicted dehydrogenase
MDGPEASTQLFGTSGYARLFPTEITRVEDWKPVTDRPRFPTREEHCDQHIFDGQMAELVAAIDESREPVPGAEHGLAVLRICDAAYRSAREDRVIEI